MKYLRQTYLSCELLDLSFNRISRCLVSKIFSLFVSLSNIWNKTQAESNFSDCGNVGALSVFETYPKLLKWQRWNVHLYTKEGLRKQIKSRRQISQPQNVCCTKKKYICISAQRAFKISRRFFLATWLHIPTLTLRRLLWSLSFHVERRTSSLLDTFCSQFKNNV